MGPVTYFHLRCYRPLEQCPVLFETDVELKGVEHEKDVERVKAWVSKWNQRFTIDESKVPTQYLAQAVQTSSTPLRRLLLEVFQYLSTKEVELLVGLTCKAWFHESRDSEYWKTRFMQEFQPETTEAASCYRAKFIANYKGSCWSCKQVLSLEEIELKCPLHKRPLCKACSQDKPECWVVSLHSFVHSRSIHPSLPAYLDIRTFMQKRTKKCYYLDMVGKLTQYAEKRRVLLLDVIDRDYSTAVSAKLTTQIRQFDIALLYKSFDYGFARLDFILADYFGRNESKEILSESIRDTIKRLQDI